MRKRSLLGGTLTFALAALLLPDALPTRAYAEASSGIEHEIAFARGLGRRQYFDWAEEVCTAIEKSAGNATDKASVQLVRAEIMKGKAAAETDIKKKMEGVSGAITALEHFISDNKDHPLAEEARFEIGELYMQKGLFIIEELKNPAATNADDLRKDGQAAFKEARTYTDNMISQIQKRMDDPAQKANAEKNETAKMTARYNLLKISYNNAMVYPEGEGARKDLLNKAVMQYQEFTLDYGDRLLNYEACILAGQAYRALGDAKNCMATFDAAVALRDSYYDDKTRTYALEEVPAEVLKNAFYQKIQAANELAAKDASFGKVAAKTADDFFETFGASWKGRPLGWVMLLEKAKGLIKVPDPKAALDLIGEVLEKTKDGPEAIHTMASQLITSLGGSVEVSPEKIIQGAEGHMAKQAYDDAINEYRHAILALKGKNDADANKLTAKAWFRMGTAFDRQERSYEAAICYQKVYSTWPDFDKDKNPYPAKACLGATRAFSNMLATGDNAFDKERYEKALGDLSSKYVTTEEGQMAPVLLGEKLMKEGKYVEAAAQFARVPEKVGISYYVQCLFQVGYCYWLEGKRLHGEKKGDDAKGAFKKAEDGYKKCSEKIQEKLKVAPEEIQDELKDIAFKCQFMTATMLMHEAYHKTDDALKLLTTIEGEVQRDIEAEKDQKKKDALLQNLGQVWILKIQAYLDQKKPEEARKLLDALLEKTPTNRKIPDACRAVAVAFHTIGEEKRKDLKDQNDTVGLDELKTAAGYYTIWLQKSAEGAKGLQQKEITAVGDLLYRVGNTTNGLPEAVGSFTEAGDKAIGEASFYEGAAKAYDLLVDPKSKFTMANAPDYWKVCVKQANCLAFMKKWDEAAKLYEGLLEKEKFLKEVVDEKTKAKFMRIDDKALREQKKGQILGVYLDLGQIYLQLGPSKKGAWEDALNVFGNIADPQISDKTQEHWWQSKLGYLRALYGSGNYARAQLIIKDLKLANPKWENGLYKLTEKFDEIEKAINEKAPNTPAPPAGGGEKPPKAGGEKPPKGGESGGK